MSPCSSPSIHRSPPFLFAPNARPLKLSAHFVFSKHRPDSGFLLPTNTWDYHEPLLITPHPWAERRDAGSDKLYWRGPVTGWDWHKGMASPESGITWRDGARAKLALSFGAKLGRGQPAEAAVLVEGDDGNGGVGLVSKTYDRVWLNEKWMDVGLSGAPVQCNREEGTCDEMQDAPMWKEPYPEHKLNRKKYTIDVGG